MFSRPYQVFLFLGLAGCVAAPGAHADFKIVIPRRSELTPVQKLNREGVAEILRHRYEKAESLFYKAYLYDPADPFTLNNLGYVSELQGQLDRAEKFYHLAQEQSCDAVIARASSNDLRGKPMMDALATLSTSNIPMRVNRMNVLAIELLSQGRGFDAQSILDQALQLSSQNPFTENNLGAAAEAVGDYDTALRYYDEAAAGRYSDPIVVTLTRADRGKPVSEVAARSAQDLRKRMRNMNLSQARATMLQLRGVWETNQNEWAAAEKDFREAYSLDPASAFALNNIGYVEEHHGDLETAQYFYARARRAGDAGARVGLATQSSAEGQHIAAIAADSDQKVGSELEVYTQNQREQKGPVELVPRYGSNPPKAGSAPAKPAQPAPSSPSSVQQQPQ